MIAKGFNSRTREGATRPSSGSTFRRSFNSRTREGATRPAPPCICRIRCFNSRTREGATARLRLQVSGTAVSIHAPVRVRHIALGHEEAGRVSIHAPVRVRPGRHYPGRRHRGFNSRTREGATSCSVILSNCFSFQFTHP